jgi:mono/diheme cytochrome c family protein
VTRAWEKRIAVAVLAAVLAALGALAYVYAASERVIAARHALPPSHVHARSDASTIALGGRLMQAYGCRDCHRPDLQGAYIADFGMRSRNLTRLQQTFSDADFDRVIRHGLKPDGTSVVEEMPADSYRYMPDADVTAILSYIRSLKPEGEDAGAPTFGLAARWDLLRGKAKMDWDWFALQPPALDLGPHYARAREMAMSACGECHMTSLGGHEGDTPDLTLVAAYEYDDFQTFMRTGRAVGSRQLRLMSATARARFSHMSDAEIRALYDYLAARGRKLTKG